jgi:hypothetical protein
VSKIPKRKEVREMRKSLLVSLLALSLVALAASPAAAVDYFLTCDVYKPAAEETLPDGFFVRVIDAKTELTIPGSPFKSEAKILDFNQRVLWFDLAALPRGRMMKLWVKAYNEGGESEESLPFELDTRAPLPPAGIKLQQ